MKKARANKNDNRLSFAAILTGGVICSVMLLICFAVVRHIYRTYAPTLGNSEHMLAVGKPQQAKMLLDKMKAAKPDADAKTLILRGKVLYSVLLEKLQEENWSSYGVNPENWIVDPLADEAEECFLKAIEISPNDPEPRCVLGNLYRDQGRFAESEAMLRSALEIDGNNAEAFLALGLLYAEGERVGAAEKALLYAWDLDEGNAKIAKNIGYFYRYYKDDPQAAILWFGRYLDYADPKRERDIFPVRSELKHLLERYPEFNDGRDMRFNPNESRIFPSIRRD